MAQGADPTRTEELRNRFNPTDQAVQRTRAFTGLWVVIGGDVAIAAAAVYGVVKSGTGQNATQIVAILTSAFTAVGTMTTAYFGIRAASNTAQAAVAQQSNGGGEAPKADSPNQPENGGTVQVVEETGGEVETAGDRPTEEPEGDTQQEQANLLRETGNERRDMTEEEEAGLLEEEFGPADADGTYGAPEGEEQGAPEGEEKL
jgi:hypothetical protein